MARDFRDSPDGTTARYVVQVYSYDDPMRTVGPFDSRGEAHQWRDRQGASEAGSRIEAMYALPLEAP